MLKNKNKLIVFFTIIALIISFSFTVVNAEEVTADESALQTETQNDIMPISEENGTAPIANTTDVTDNTDSTDGATDETAEGTTPETTDDESSETADQEIHEDDLYLFGSSVKMDKLVDGNVYIFGNDVEITGQINGNLFVFANNLKFSSSYTRYSIFAFADNIEFDGACNDLYAACNNLNLSYDSYIVRDVRIVAAQKMDFLGAVGRNAFLTSTNYNFGEGEQAALIYGNLNYTSPSEITIPDGVVEGTVTFNQAQLVDSNKSIQEIVIANVFSLLKALLYTIIVYLLICWLAPKFVKKSAEYVSGKMGAALGIGILASIVAIVASIALLSTTITAPIAFTLFTIYGLLMSISFATVAICITKKFAKDAGKGKTIGILVLVTIILWALTTLIPVASAIISLIVSFIGLGIILMYAFTKNKATTETVTEIKE